MISSAERIFKKVYFKGDNSGDGVDYAYNARMAKIAESQQGMAKDYFKFWENHYKPMEKDQIAANRELIPLETDFNKENIQAQRDLLPGQVAFGKAQLDDSMTAISERAPVRTSFYNEAVNGIDVNDRVNNAAADASQSFMNSNNIMRRNASRMGINPNSGRFTDMMNTNSLNRAKTIAGARTQARTQAETEKFGRLSTAMNY